MDQITHSDSPRNNRCNVMKQYDMCPGKQVIACQMLRWDLYCTQINVIWASLLSFFITPWEAAQKLKYKIQVHNKNIQKQSTTKQRARESYSNIYRVT